MWLGHDGRGLVSFDGTNWVVYDTVNSGLPDNNVSSVIIDNEGTKWIGTWNGGLAAFNDDTWTVYDTLNSELTSNSVYCIAIDRQGTKWIGTWDGGLTAFNENGIPESIENIENEQQIARIYPNPTYGPLTVKMKYHDRLSIEINSLKGDMILEEDMDGGIFELNLSSFQEGVYFITIRSDDFVTTRKIIKH